MRCQAVTHRQSAYDMSPRGNRGCQCHRKAVYRDESGGPEHGKLFCRQHAKDIPTILRKSTGQIRPGLNPIKDDLKYG